MPPLNDVPPSRHRVFPLLTLGLAVLALLGIAVWWPTPPPPRLVSLRIESVWDLLEQPKVMKFLGGAVVTIPVLICSLYVIVSRRYRDVDKKWAYGAVGTLLGFWLGAT
jgi:hypothetical protein